MIARNNTIERFSDPSKVNLNLNDVRHQKLTVDYELRG